MSVIWGGSFFFIEITVRCLTPITIVACRVGLASIFLLAVLTLTGRRLPASLAMWKAFFVMGAINNVIPFCLIIWGQNYIDSGPASILNAFTPIFSVVLAHFLTKEERLTLNRGVGVLLGWAGVIMLIGPTSLKGAGLEVLGKLAVVAATFCYACAAIYGRRFKNQDPMVVAAGMLCASTVITFPLALALDRPWTLSPDTHAVLALAGLSLVSTSAAYLIYFKVLATAGPTNLLLVTFLIPVSANILGVAVLGEKPGLNTWGGMALIFSGLVFIDGRLARKIKSSG